MESLRIVLAALLTLLLSEMVFAASPEAEWELMRDKNEVQVYTRSVPDSAYKAFRGETVLDVELNRVMALMDDTEACVDWMHSCTSPRLIRKLSPLDRYTYMVNDLPWPATDRALLLRATISQQLPERIVTVALESVAPESLSVPDQQRLPESNGAVLVEKAQGFFRFTPLENDQTHVEYQMHLELGGALPASMVNAQLVDTPYHTLKNMRKQVLADQYRDFRPF